MAFLMIFAGGVVSADAIRSACLKSDRGYGQSRLCHCIQGAADGTLSGSDQRRAARFFKNPEEAQRIRRSDNRRDEAFWERYERFGATARKHCGRRG